MDLLLVSANRERSPYPVFPLGLAYLVPSLEAAGHRLRVLDLCFAQEPEAALLATLEEFRPRLVVISIRNLDNVTWPTPRSYLDGLHAILSVCRGRALTVLGGSGFSLLPQELLAELDADYGVVGEGEELLPRLLAALEAGLPPDDLPGVVVRGGKGFLPPRPVERIGMPDRRLFRVQDYLKEGGMANLQTKRGCPFSCTYCTYPILEGRRVRVRPAAEVVAEIRLLVDEAGVDYIYFVDDIFNYPVDYALELCRAMTAARLAIRWSAFINPQFLPAELLDAMVAAGCDAVEFGSDSGSAAMLASLGKSFGVEEICAASRLCREMGVDFAHYMLLGGPGETRETVLESFQLMDQLEPTAVIGMTGIRIYPGTQLHLQALAEGQLSPAEPLLLPRFYLAPGIRQCLSELVTEQARQRGNWIVPGLEINVSDSLLEALRHFQVRGPLWKLMKGRNRSRSRHGVAAAAKKSVAETAELP